MPEIAGENLVPLGVAGSGAAYILGSREPNALAILEQGARARALAAERARLAKLKADAENAKQFNDFAKFQQDGSPYFGEALQDKVYKPVMEQVTDAFKRNRDDLFARNVEIAPILQRTNNETVQSKAKTQYITDQMRGFQADKNLIDAEYAGKTLSAALRKEDGGGRLPSEFDEEAHFNSLRGDHRLYKEPEVIRRATDKLMPIISQKVAEAGSIGGQHTADQVRGRFVAFKNGKPILNADGSPKLNLTADTQALLEADPLLKLKLDAREAAYNEKREADPNLPRMSRRGHLAQMVGPMAFYDQSHDEGLNRLPPQPKSSGAGPAPFEAPVFGGEETRYNLPLPTGKTETVPLGDSRIPNALPSAHWKAPQVQQDYAVAGTPVAPPVDISKSGKVTNKHVDAWVPDNFDLIGTSGKREHRKNNTQPMSGYPGESHGAYVDAKTGEHLYPKSAQEGDDLVRAGKAKLRVQFDFNSEKGENFAARVKETADALLQEKNADFKPKYPTRDLAEAAARKQLSTGTVRSTHLYTPQNSATVDRLFGDTYRRHQSELNRRTAQLRAEGPPKGAVNSKPLYTPKSKSGTTSTPTSSADPTGGLYKRRR